MSRPVLLFTGSWTDLPIEEVAALAGSWQYQGLELASWGRHFEPQRSLADPDYGPALLETLQRHGLSHLVLSCHRAGTAVCDPPGPGLRRLLPDYVWGDGDPEGIRQRAAEEVLGIARAAATLGVSVISGFTGSPIWARAFGYPRLTSAEVRDGLGEFARRWRPILDEFRELGLRFALEVHPGQIAFDMASAESALEAVDGSPEFGFTLDPAHLAWQGIDPCAFVRRFPGRIFHVHARDIVIRQDGGRGCLNGYLPSGNPGRGWDFRTLGRGHLDWEELVRALNHAGYHGPLSVEAVDPYLDRGSAAEEALPFLRRFDTLTEPAFRQEPGTQEPAP
jgi:sugar phosphate isomerase/epimerase